MRQLLIARAHTALHQVCVSHPAMLINQLVPLIMTSAIVNKILIVDQAYVLPIYVFQIVMEIHPS